MVKAHVLPTIYWINLERSCARRLHMEHSLKAHGLTGVRVRALDGRDGSAVQHAIRSRAENPCVAACLESHLRAIRSAFAAGEEVAIFMEDDASFELLSRWPGDFRQVLSDLPSAWSALWLGYGDTPQRLDHLFSLAGMAVPVPSLTLWSTVAYALHRRAMAYLLAQYDRGTCFDVSSFPEAHEADTLLLRSLARAPDLAYPHVLRIPMFTFLGHDSEIHAADLPRQVRARAFVLEAHEALLRDGYRSRFGLRQAVRRMQRALQSALGLSGADAQARHRAGTQEGRKPSTKVTAPDAESV